MTQNLDILWKGLLEDTFDDFLRFVNPNADALLDLSRGVQFLDTELKQTFRPEKGIYRKARAVDKLARVFTREGREEFVLVHVEVQGQYQQDFARRMFQYYYRLFDKYNRRITAYVIFLESNTIVRPDAFEQEFMGTVLRYKFNVLKIADMKEEDLLVNENPFAMAVLAARSTEVIRGIKNTEERDARLMRYKLTLIRILLERNYPKTKISALLEFLIFYLTFENKELIPKFDFEVNSLIKNKGGNMGIKEQIIEILKAQAIKERKQAVKERKQQREEIIKNLMNVKGFADAEIAEVVDIPLWMIRRIRLRNHTMAVK